MTKRERKKRSPEAKIVTICLEGLALQNVVQKQANHLIENKNALSRERAIIFLLEGK